MRQHSLSSRQVFVSVVVFVAATLGIALSPALARTDRTNEPQPSAHDFYDRGIAERKSGRSDAAIVLLSLAAAHEPDDPDIRLQLALAFMAVRRVDAAERQLRRAERLSPGDADVGIALTYVALFQGRKLEAEARTKRLLKSHPEREDVIALTKRLKQPTPPARDVGLRLARFDGSISYAHFSGGRPAPKLIARANGRQQPLNDRSSGQFILSYRFQPS